MAWVTSKTNGNSIFVEDEDVARYFEAQGHKLSDSDPREAKPRTAKKSD